MTKVTTQQGQALARWGGVGYTDEHRIGKEALLGGREMRVSCLQENLSRGLGVVGRAVPTRATLPITSKVLLATDQGRLKLVSTNLEIALTCWIGAKVEEEGGLTIPARLLEVFVNSLPADK